MLWVCACAQRDRGIARAGLLLSYVILCEQEACSKFERKCQLDYRLSYRISRQD